MQGIVPIYDTRKETMRTRTIFLTLTVLFAWQAGSAIARDLFFTKTDGYWHETDSWNPEGPVTADDTVHIQNGQTCRVVPDYAAVAKAFDVQAGATLTLYAGVYFFVGSCDFDNGQQPSSTLNGTLRFEPGGSAPVVWLKMPPKAQGGHFHLNGSGTLTASAADNCNGAEFWKYI